MTHFRLRNLAGIALAIPSALAAQEETGSEFEIRDAIIVTGERVSRGVLETASSVVVITDTDIEQIPADRLDQLLGLVPNLQLGSGEEAPAIRGQDGTGQLRNLFAFLGGARPRVTLQVDGRAANYYEFVSGVQSAWDIAQVEVFRSPQTATQGRNSIAGAIFVTTQQPANAWEGRVRTILGDFDSRQVSAVVSGPVFKDELAFRISGDLKLGEVTTDMTDAISGASIERDDYGTGRLKLLYTPKGLPGARLETTLAYTKSQAPQFEGVSAPFNARKLPVPNQMIGVMKVDATSFTARAEYAIEAGLVSTLTVSYGDAVLNRFGLPGLGRARADTRDISFEPTLRWEGSDAFGVLLGAHLLASDQDQFIDVTGFGIGTGTFVDEQESLGLFGEATWRLAGALSFSAGVRYQQDRQMRSGALGPITLDYDQTFDAWLPKLSMSYKLTDAIVVGVLAQRAYNPGGTTISLLRRQADDFTAEYLWNYEVFVRAATGDGSAVFSANVFYNDIENAQRPQLVPVRLPTGNTVLATEYANAPASRAFGVEADLRWRLSQRMNLRLAGGLLQTKILRTIEPGDPLLGKAFQRSPAFSGALALEWEPIDRLNLSTQLRHQSGYFSDDRNNPMLRIEASTVVDGRAAYDFGSVNLFGFMRNSFDTFNLTYLFNPTFGSAGKPREIGAGVEARF